MIEGDFTITIRDNKDNRILLEQKIDRVNYNMSRDVRPVTPVGSFTPGYMEQKGSTKIVIQCEYDNQYKFNEEQMSEYYGKKTH